MKYNLKYNIAKLKIKHSCLSTFFSPPTQQEVLVREYLEVAGAALVQHSCRINHTVHSFYHLARSVIKMQFVPVFPRHVSAGCALGANCPVYTLHSRTVMSHQCIAKDTDLHFTAS